MPSNVGIFSFMIIVGILTFMSMKFFLGLVELSMKKVFFISKPE